MLINFIKARVFVSDLAFRLASWIPKECRAAVKENCLIQNIFRVIKSREFVEQHSLKVLSERQEADLRGLPLPETPLTQHSIQVVIDAQHASHTDVEVTVNSILNQDYPAAGISIVGMTSGDWESSRLQNSQCKILQTPVFDQVFWRSTVSDSKSGEYLMMVHAGDCLSRHSLKAFMCEAVEHPECDAFYSDVIICRGSKPVAECRPAFCPDYLREYNYIASSVVFSKGAIENALFTDYGDVLSAEALNHTCLLHIAGNHGRVAHLPYFLLEDGNSEGPDAKKFSKLARQVLEELGIREGYSVEDGEFSEVVRVDWNPPADAPLVSIIIPTKDQLDLLCQCINSVFQKTSWENFEIIIVNNQSAQKETQDYLEMVSGFPKVKVLDYSKPFNYSAINNFAVSKAEGEFIVLLNNDVEVISPDWLSIMLGQAAREEVGCVGANLFFPDDTHQHAGVIVGYGGVAGHAHKFFERGHRGYMNRLICTQNYSAVTAACLLISKKKFLELGGLDEVNLTVAFNDVDLCLKAAAKGYLNVWVPGAMLYHHESVSRGSDKFGEAKIRFLNEIAFMKSRWITDKFEDRAYNRNLTLKREDFSLKKFF